MEGCWIEWRSGTLEGQRGEGNAVG